MRLMRIFLALLVLFQAATYAAEAMHGGGRTVTVAEIHPGRFRSELETLAPAAQNKALTRLSRMSFHDHDLADLHADRHGGVYFACRNGAPATTAPTTAAAPPAILRASVPIANQPSYHSKAGAVNRIYLDFNGATVTQTVWNGGTVPDPLICPSFDLDGQPTTFNDAEQTIILEVWQRMAEDYAPFNVDVTTDPGIENSLNNTTGHVVITTKNIGIEPTAGGVAYVGVFGEANYASATSPAFVFYDNLSNNESYIAEACAHEMGHNVGLDHDATNADPSYYSGHGSGPTSWGPIMGTGFDRNVSQFSKGEYFDANNHEDDLSIIASFLNYRADDFGDSDAAATDISGTTLQATGIISHSTDVDVVSFSCGAGPIVLSVATWLSPEHTHGGNLDVKLALYDASGNFISAAAPVAAANASIARTVVAGTYFLHITNDGEGNPLSASPTGYTSYGSLGQWTLTGTTPPTTIATIVATTAQANESGPIAGVFTVTLSPAPLTNTTLSYAISGSAINGTDYQSIPTSVTIPGSTTGATNASATITVTPINDGITESPESVTLTLTASTTYVIGAAAAATVSISDVPAPSTTGSGSGTGAGSTTGAPASASSDGSGDGGGLCGAGSMAVILGLALMNFASRRRERTQSGR